MPKITADASGRLTLPPDFLARRHMPAQAEYWLDERQGDLILHPATPDAQKLYIEATTGCNLHCRTCIRNIWGDPIALITETTFASLLESLAGLPELKRVIFTGFGEPLSHPRILDMIAQVRQRGLPVSVGSNGLLLTERMTRSLVELGVDRLVVSVDGVRPETYSDVRGALLNEVLDNLRRLNDIKAELNTLMPALGIEFVALKSNLAELPQLASLAMHLNAARILVTNVLPYTADMRAEMLYGYDPQPSLAAVNWPVHTGAWVTWGALELPRMHWGAERRCRFVQDRA
ncbi:MAG TPA: radical SAM protein, partial [Anaerolineaceae bacterium]|nr:radical SAM protein [Anaerolineaceae bacterium]